MMPADDAISSLTDAERPSPLTPGTPLAIQVEDLHKSFSIPTNRVDSLKERVVRPFSGRDHRQLHALDGVSFEIHQGEFFGIVGRNGSGKSTLLKLLASIYRADAGTIRMAGRLAPFIELGVGFNPELTARENVVLNGVMMGLTPQETRSRLDAIVEFAELTEFIDLKLKNYSSGMLVRLAFSVMMEADADVLLIDEVLAVGDAAFQQKCADAFREMKAAGKTIVLVTHEMRTVEEYCHRAMLVSDGSIHYIGDPEEVGRRYLQLNFEHEGGSAEPDPADESLPSSDEVRMLDSWIEDAEGNRLDNLEHGSELRLRVDLEILEDVPGLEMGFVIANADGVGIFQFAVRMANASGGSELAAGERVRVKADIENLLVQGRYFVNSAVNRIQDKSIALHAHECVDFVVFGGEPQAHGNVRLPMEIEAVVSNEAER
ncbi:MAG TPA: ABC transporter ATP-binding protein [Solirubrobacterales bacterium]|nr:ABC transporter ATP-binding protein [Solirubrobacterales bacterium]